MTARPHEGDVEPTAEPRAAALAWFTRLNSGEATAADRQAFDRWMAADPRHREEYDRLCGVWRDLDALPDPRPQRPGAPSRRQLLRTGAMAAGIGALAVAGGSWVAAQAGLHRTGTGERRTMTAPDGSRIDLDAASAVDLDFTPDLRRVRLVEGRALFTVARDAARPFEVDCPGGTVRALGTAFVVHRRAQDVLVAVQEGEVSVTSRVAGAAADVQLSPGRRVAFDARGIGPVEDVPGGRGAAEETAWLRGKLIFEDRPLSDVVADLDRYRPGWILLWDETLAGLRVSGIFDTDRPDAALEAIVRTLPVRRISLAGHLILLRPA